MPVDTTVGTGEPTATRASRAVERLVERGNDATCTGCRERIRFAARNPQRQVIANVYTNGVWRRVEHYHAPCYQRAGAPFGAPAQKPVASR